MQVYAVISLQLCTTSTLCCEVCASESPAFLFWKCPFFIPSLPLARSSSLNCRRTQHLPCLLLFYFESGSRCVAQACLQLRILLSTLECWNYMNTSPSLFFLSSISVPLCQTGTGIQSLLGSCRTSILKKKWKQTNKQKMECEASSPMRNAG